jgi:RNA polymerase sigma factor (sigma-70 family)
MRAKPVELMEQNLLNNTLTDTEVLDRVLAGETGLYEIIIRRHNPLLYKIGRSYGLQHEDVQDAMQDTYITGYEKLHQFQGRSQLSTWLTRIMINKCIYKMKRRVEKIPLNAADENFEEHTAATLAGKFPLQIELKRIMELSLEKLPEPYRMVFLLRETENFSVAQTAEALNISEINVKVRLNRAKAMLRENLEQWYTRADIYEFNLKYCTQVVNAVLNKITNN